MLIMVGEFFSGIADSFVEGLAGGFLVFFAMLVGRNLSNIMVFRCTLRNRNHDSGSTIDSHEMDLRVSFYRHLGNLLPLIVIAMFSTRAFAVGGCLGGMLLLAAHLDWIRQHNRKQAVRSIHSDGRGEL